MASGASSSWQLPDVPEPSVPGSGADGQGTERPEWPKVKCKICGKMAKWSKMRNKKIWQNFQAIHSDPDDRIIFEHARVPCYAAELGASEQDWQCNHQVDAKWRLESLR